ncbi:hypothetical protein [Lentzea sp.]|uniref:hypothetical protein n=1 Tax=Lentzea sp. TaxID=56099 RepID=UPI002C8B1050|nr:hypothetical protein [Lentzea sp.]HUQ54806.1 hypothetical protein [Lentzea sp.]
MSVELSTEAMKRLRRLHPVGKGIFTSDLSVNEFLLVRQAGFLPLGLVLGVSISYVSTEFRRWNTNQGSTCSRRRCTTRGSSR